MSSAIAALEAHKRFIAFMEAEHAAHAEHAQGSALEECATAVRSGLEQIKQYFASMEAEHTEGSEALTQLLVLGHAEHAMCERELDALVSSNIRVAPTTDTLTSSQKKRRKKQQSAERRQEQIKGPEQSVEVQAVRALQELDPRVAQEVEKRVGVHQAITRQV